MSHVQSLRRWVRRHERLRRLAGKLAGRVSQLRTRSLSVRERWSRAIPYESGFWDDWLATKAFGNEAEYEARLDPKLRVDDPLLAERLDEFAGPEVAILDVGAGPLTTIGRTHPGKDLRIVAIDPLAADYDRILAKAGVTPPVRTIAGEGETLLEQFDPVSFDVAYSANALDHCYDPLSVISNMVEVVRPGGFVLLRHRRNEAEAKDYLGLHQWNFDIRDGRFVIWNRSSAQVVAEALSGKAKIRAHEDADEVVCVLLRSE
jgi:SAM-dependent methyltransferase